MTQNFVRAFSVVTLLMVTSLSAATDRSEMIAFFIQLENVEDRADQIVEDLKDELIKSDKNITDSNFDRTFGEDFEDYREAYITANEDAYGVYSDSQIKQLYDFYKSPFGEWYRQEEKAFGPRVNENMKEANQILRAEILSKRNKGKKRRR